MDHKNTLVDLEKLAAQANGWKIGETIAKSLRQTTISGREVCTVTVQRGQDRPLYMMDTRSSCAHDDQDVIDELCRIMREKMKPKTDLIGKLRALVDELVRADLPVPPGMEIDRITFDAILKELTPTTGYIPTYSTARELSLFGGKLVLRAY